MYSIQSSKDPLEPFNQIIPTNDTLQKIFLNVIPLFSCQVVKNTNRLRLISKQGRHVIDSYVTGQLVFKLLGLNFPENPSTPWQALYRSALVDVILHGSLQKKTIPFPNRLHFQNEEIMWIDDWGFVAYEKMATYFRVFMLDHLESPFIIHLKDHHMVCSLLVSNDCVFCGTQKGAIFGYSAKTKEHLFTGSMHDNPILYLFAYREGWISICAEKIVQWNVQYKPLCLLSNYAPSDRKDLITKCFLAKDYLFFKYENPDFSNDVSFCYSLTLNPPGQTLESMHYDALNSQEENFVHGVSTYVLGNEMMSIRGVKNSITQQKTFWLKKIPFDHQSYFKWDLKFPSHVLTFTTQSNIPEPHRDCFSRDHAVLLLDEYKDINAPATALRFFNLQTSQKKSHLVHDLEGNSRHLFENQILNIQFKYRQVVCFKFIHSPPS